MWIVGRSVFNGDRQLNRTLKVWQARCEAVARESVNDVTVTVNDQGHRSVTFVSDEFDSHSAICRDDLEV